MPVDESAEPGRAAPEPDLTGDPAVDTVLSRLEEMPRRRSASMLPSTAACTTDCWLP